MKAGNRGTIEEARLLTAKQAAIYTGMGLNSCRAWCDSIGATKKFSGRLVRFDKRVIDKALDNEGGE